MIDKRRDFWLCYQEFSAKAEEMINLALTSLRHTLFSTCTPDFAEVQAVVDALKPLRSGSWLSFQLPEAEKEEVLDPLVQSVGNSLVHWLLTSRKLVIDPTNNIMKYVSSQKHVPPGTQLETREEPACHQFNN